MRYAILVYEHDTEPHDEDMSEGGPQDPEASGGDQVSVVLRPPYAATTVRCLPGGTVLVPGTAQEAGGEQLTRMHLVEAADLDHAVALARGFTSAGTVEVRPIAEERP
ncbi:hypothetical protein GCM10009799_09160 [Nocardiopsis rhodophaea]|uniref:YCII-related domain-containing protein n=1 Tax=Nocardiopsis rhodophaea TaxID=280238 RepID=A0ABP5DT55_9ACTN